MMGKKILREKIFSFLMVALSMTFIPYLTPQSLQAETDEREELAYTTGVTAYVWGYPLVRMGQIREYRTGPLSPEVLKRVTLAPLNTIGHAHSLYGPEFRGGPGPNNDTLYSTGWVDLKDGPMILMTPGFGDRYYTFTIYDAFSSGIASPGMRTHGSQIPPIAIIDPEWQGSLPKELEIIRVSTRYVLIAGRILVDGEADIKNVLPLQQQIKLVSLDQYLNPQKDITKGTFEQRPLDDPAQDVPEDLRFYEKLGQILKDQPPAPDESGFLGFFKNIGLSVENGFDYNSLDEPTIRGLKRALPTGAEIVEEKSLNLGYNVNGWTINPHGSRFGNDYLLRAGVAKDQICVTIPEEAIYPIARVDGDGWLLNGANAYKIIFKGGNFPPVKAFWSITLYDDSGFMVENLIDRYSFGDRTKGMNYERDGSLIIRIQHDPPEENQKTNWLPAPEGNFYLMMRLYIPEESVLNRSWQPPPVAKIS